MKLHPRFKVTQEASDKISKAVSDIQNDYELTDWELVGILLEEALQVKRYALRSERHPNDSNKKADEA